MIHLLPPIFLLAILAYAYFDQAPKDARDIYLQNPIDHKDRWLSRLQTGAGIFALAALVCIFSFEVNPLRITPLVISGFFGFSLVFRLRLNAMRGYGWVYMAPWSNRYDLFFWSIACRLTHRAYMIKVATIHRDGDLIGKWFIGYAKTGKISGHIAPPFRLAPAIQASTELTATAAAMAATHYLIS